MQMDLKEFRLETEEIFPSKLLLEIDQSKHHYDSQFKGLQTIFKDYSKSYQYFETRKL